MKIPVSVMQNALARIIANAILNKSAMTVVSVKTARQTALVKSN